ncbi:MAG: hypothetical protein WCG25_06295 [bacterium]
MSSAGFSGGFTGGTIGFSGGFTGGSCGFTGGSAGFFHCTLSLNVLKNNGTGKTNLSYRELPVHGLFSIKSALNTLSVTLCNQLPTISYHES